MARPRREFASTLAFHSRQRNSGGKSASSRSKSGSVFGRRAMTVRARRAGGMRVQSVRGRRQARRAARTGADGPGRKGPRSAPRRAPGVDRKRCPIVAQYQTIGSKAAIEDAVRRASRPSSTREQARFLGKHSAGRQIGLAFGSRQSMYAHAQGALERAGDPALQIVSIGGSRR